MEQQEIRDPMPEDMDNWSNIDAGPNLWVAYNPDRQLGGRAPDGIERRTILIALSGRQEQAIRLDPFSEGAHYHIRPARGRGQIPLEVADGQTPLEAALAFFADADLFRSMLRQAEPGTEINDSFVTSDDLAHAARIIRAIDARAA